MTLNTIVNGNPDSCHRAADWFGDLAGAGASAADTCRDAISTTDSGWTGPASEAFRYSVNDPRLLSLDLEFTCDIYERGVREFAGALEAVIRQMADAVDHATANGLEVADGIIIPPEPPILPPSTIWAEYSAEQKQEAVGPHNEKVDVYNECVDMVGDARVAEQEAHDQLLTSFEGLDGEAPSLANSGIDGWTLAIAQDGVTALSGITSFADIHDKTMAAMTQQADNYAKMSSTYYKLAMGNLEAFTAGDRALLDQTLKNLRGLSDSANKAEQYDDYLRRLGKIDNLLGRVPGAGESLTVLNEALSALRGEQGWGESAARATMDISAGIAGTARGASWAARLGPNPIVILAGGIIGGAIGTFGAGQVADAIWPGDQGEDPYEDQKLGHFEGYSSY